MFIVFEGPDHAGKTTLINKLKEEFKKEKFKTWFTYEPGGTPIGEAVRSLLKDSNYEINDICEAYLFAGIRNQHCEKINKKMNEDYTVICDRFVQSSYVYQGILTGNSSIVYNINHMATRGLKPDLVILITCDPEESISRLGASDRIELKTRENAKLIYDSYEELYEAGKLDGEDWYRIDTSGKNENESFEELLNILKPYYINFSRE